jgi:hypothetical protein
MEINYKGILEYVAERLREHTDELAEDSEGGDVLFGQILGCITALETIQGKLEDEDADLAFFGLDFDVEGKYLKATAPVKKGGLTMLDFRVIYKLLRVYKKLLCDAGNPRELTTPEALGTLERHAERIFFILRDAGLLRGETIGNAAITLQGLEYLEENVKMKEVAKGT